MEKSKTVLVFMPSTGNFAILRQAGVWRVARSLGWRMHTAVYSVRPGCRYRLRRSPSGGSLHELFEFWKPDACIVDCGGEANAIPSREFGPVPTVFIDPPNPVVGARRNYVVSDESDIARHAGCELEKSGFADFAFIPWPGKSAWSRERGVAFASFVAKAGKRLHSFVHPPGALETERMSRNLVPWLRSLPKPVGVFAVNDAVGEAVLLACAALGISVPDQVGVIGVDDLGYICENAVPTLSSIQRDFGGAGAAAAELLAKMLDEPDALFPFGRYGAGRTVRRESTRFEKFRDRRVAKAREFIRLNACSGIGPADVARAMHVSRRGADAAFRKTAGRTILDEIHEVRIAAACDMLARGIRPDIVAQDCGYSSVNDFRRVFKKRMGDTVLRWLTSKRS